jgi:hypothetical protein
VVAKANAVSPRPCESRVAESGRFAFFGASVATPLGLLAAEQLTVAERVSVVAGAAGADAADPEDGRRALAGFGEASGRPATRR